MANAIGLHTVISPQGSIKSLHRVRMRQGSQIIRVPEGSSISNITLNGGASCNSRWAALRGAVLKFAPDRTDPVEIDGYDYKVPSGHTLMDRQSYNWTVTNRNGGQPIPHILVRRLTPNECFYLTHAGYCHPKELFLPQGEFTNISYLPRNILEPHLQLSGRTLIVDERRLEVAKQPMNILAGLDKIPSVIKVRLAEGGLLTLKNR